MRSIFPDAIDGDLLKLIHHSNGFCLVPSAKLLQVGNAHIAAVKNPDVVKAVQVKL